MRKELCLSSGDNGVRTSIKRVGRILRRNLPTLAICAAMTIMMVGQVYAEPDADSLWQTVANLLKTWVTRLGGTVMFVGGIMFGLGWKNDDADGKTRGINTVIAGAIVCAVAVSAGTFMGASGGSGSGSTT